MDETAEVNGAEPTARSAVREGPRLGTIIDEILYSNVDVAVVGSHGKTCTGRKLLAGTVGGLLHDLPTSLLIVPSSASRQSFC